MTDIDKTIAELKRTEQFLIEYEFDGHIRQVHDAIELLKQMPIKLKPGDRIMIPENFTVAKAIENGIIDI